MAQYSKIILTNQTDLLTLYLWFLCRLLYHAATILKINILNQVSKLHKSVLIIYFYFFLLPNRCNKISVQTRSGGILYFCHSPSSHLHHWLLLAQVSAPTDICCGAQHFLHLHYDDSPCGDNPNSIRAEYLPPQCHSHSHANWHFYHCWNLPSPGTTLKNCYMN